MKKVQTVDFFQRVCINEPQDTFPRCSNIKQTLRKATVHKIFNPIQLIFPFSSGFDHRGWFPFLCGHKKVAVRLHLFTSLPPEIIIF